MKDVRGRAMEQIEGAADRDVPVIDPIGMWMGRGGCEC